MIELGKNIQLNILKHATVGLYLTDESGEEVLLPNKYCTEEMKPRQSIEVFVYRDSEDRKVATTLMPDVYLHEFAQLKVKAVTKVGAFMDWGLEKDLMVPFREQKQDMEEGRWYIIYLNLDEKTDRLYASNRLERFLQNDTISVQEGQEVDLIIQQKTDLGFAVIINNKHRGLIFENEIFQEVRVGEKLKGFVQKIRNDGKIDVSLQATGFQKANEENTGLILAKLEEYEGFLPLNDKSTPEEITGVLGISKKAFKKTIGSLYKQHKIEISPEGIKLLKPPTPNPDES